LSVKLRVQTTVSWNNHNNDDSWIIIFARLYKMQTEMTFAA